MTNSCYDQYKEWNNDQNRDPNSIFAKVVYAKLNLLVQSGNNIKLVLEGDECPPCAKKVGEGKMGGVYLPYQPDEGPPYTFYTECDASTFENPVTFY